MYDDLGKGNNSNCQFFFPCLLNRKNIRHKATHHEKFVPSRRMSNILTYVYELR